MDNLEPITRNEMFLNGDDLEPITREEMILAGADLEPLTRHEWFLKKYRGSGDVTIERLAVTENGTYSESGKAYSPVVVNVPAPPIPENAYLLNDLSGLPADIASFNDGTDLPMASLKVAVTPYQDLSHGDPSPSNICPIIGWDKAVVTVADDVDNPTVSHEYTIDLDGTRYGGVLDATNGTMTVDRVIAVLDGSSDEAWDMAQGAYLINNIFNGDFTTSATNPVCMCNMYEEGNAISSSSQVPTRSDFSFFNQSNYKDRLWVKDSKYSTVEDFKTALASQPLQIIYPLATPITVQLAPQAVKSLEGENKIFANCGQITEGKYFKRA